MQSKPAPVTFPPGALRPRAPTWPGGSRARGSRLWNWCVFCALPADVSRCVAERKYTQEQARKELQQVFIPECNNDGTYSQVRPLAPSGPRSVCSQLWGGRGCPWGPPCTAGKGVPGGADCHRWRWSWGARSLMPVPAQVSTSGPCRRPLSPGAGLAQP